jgi:hypothetical protein
MPFEKSDGGQMKANSERAKYWRQQVESFQASGMTRTAYCEANQIRLNTLDYWRKKFNAPEKKNETGWMPIKIAEDNSTGIDLQIGRITIAVKPGFDRTLLLELLQAVNALC